MQDKPEPLDYYSFTWIDPPGNSFVTNQETSLSGIYFLRIE
jgi:hypothetical protein